MLESAGRILLVDPEAASRDVIQAALTHAGHRVDPASNLAEAVDKLATDVFDLVISELHLGDQDGLSLLDGLQLDPAKTHIGFIILSAERTPAARLAAFERGIDDFLTKPCVIDELMARVGAILRRSRKSAAAGGGEATASFSGQIAAISIEELLQFVEMGRKTGLMIVNCSRAVARVYFDKGQIHGASFADIQGEEAIYLLFAVRDGQFEFHHGVKPVGERTVTANLPSLLLEGLRRMDETVNVIQKAKDERIKRDTVHVRKHNSTSNVMKPLKPGGSAARTRAIKKPAPQASQAPKKPSPIQRTVKSAGPRQQQAQQSPAPPRQIDTPPATGPKRLAGAPPKSDAGASHDPPPPGGKRPPQGG